jgi:putative phosphoribosyl transferase
VRACYTADMYFKSRAQAGKLLSEQIVKKYKGQDCAVVALSDGAVMVGAQIAVPLHCVLTMLLTEAINLPREDVAVAGMSQNGTLTYNNYYSPGEIEDFLAEYHNLIEEQKIDKMQHMNQLLGKGGLIKKGLIRDRNIILVSDGLANGFSLDIAVEFLKPIRIKKIIVATPFATVSAVDRMHIQADEIFCLNVVEQYISTDHYYETRDVPDHQKIVRIIEDIVDRWQ